MEGNPGLTDVSKKNEHGPSEFGGVVGEGAGRHRGEHIAEINLKSDQLCKRRVKSFISM